MSYQEDLILYIYGRGEPGLAMADPLPKDDPHRRVPAPGKDGVPSSPYPPGKSPMPSIPDLAMDFNDTGLGDGGFISTDKPHIYINRGAEAYILMPDGDFRFDGMYDPKRHGNAFPGLGLVQNQANEGMMIAKKKKKNKELTIYDEAARRDAFRDMAEEPYDPDTGRLGGGFDIMDDLLDGV